MAAIQPMPRRKRPTTGNGPVVGTPENWAKRRKRPSIPKMPGRNKPVTGRPVTPGTGTRRPTRSPRAYGI